jgi:phosphate transport system substrate-binding protein
VVIIVHADNPVTGLTYAQIDALYSASRLRGAPPVAVWGDLGLQSDPWTTMPVRVLGGGRVGAEDSAKAATVRRRVLDLGYARGTWREGLDAAVDEDTAVPAQVAADREAVGISALAHLRPGVRAVPIAESAGGPFVAPTRDRVYDGSYPLTRTIDLLISVDSSGSVDPAIAEFARFLLSREAQALVLEQGVFLPLDRVTYGASSAMVESWRRCR